MENPRVRRKEILKIREEINVKETEETIAKINKGKSWFFELNTKENLQDPASICVLEKKKGENNQ